MVRSQHLLSMSSNYPVSLLLELYEDRV